MSLPVVLVLDDVHVVHDFELGLLEG